MNSSSSWLLCSKEASGTARDRLMSSTKTVVRSGVSAAHFIVPRIMHALLDITLNYSLRCIYYFSSTSILVLVLVLHIYSTVIFTLKS